MRIIFTLLLLSFAVFSSAVKVNYILSMDKPHEHYFKVDIAISEFSGKYADFKMPAWAPGSYLIREFSKNVDWVEAKADDRGLKCYKTDKNTWRVETNGSKYFTFSYKVYAYELSVRTSFLDADHAAIHGASVFMYLDKMKNLSGELTIFPGKEWNKISTGMDEIYHEYPNKEIYIPYRIFSFSDYDVLIDSPIEIGNHLTFSFEAAGCRHEVAMFGEGNFDTTQLKSDMKVVVEAATEVYGENPNKRYVFIVHNLTNGSGGLEHLNSTTLQVNRWTYSDDRYNAFLSLVAHEYFHLWNVKRARANTLGPFDYDKENYTTLLWVMEGFTSYYDELLLKRSGYYSQSEYLRTLVGSLSSLENSPGSKVQSVAESSFDAWIKGYRPNENSNNTSISYYTKGSVLGALLDLEIITSTKGEKNLDDLMSFVYQNYYKKEKRGFNETEFKLAAEKVAGKKLDAFFNDYVYSTKKINYNFYLNQAGLQLDVKPRNNESWLGIRATDNSGKLIINNVTSGGSGYESGLNVNDEIIAVNGYRCDNATMNKLVGMYEPGDEIEFLISRDNLLRTIKVKLLTNTMSEFKITPMPSPTPDQNKLLKKWLE